MAFRSLPIGLHLLVSTAVLASLWSVSGSRPEASQSDPSESAATMQGVWQSKDDAKYVIEIAGNRLVDRYGAETTRVATLAFVNSCEGRPESAENRYFLVTDDDGPLCYYLLSADDSELSYSYVARGNTLSFSKLQDLPAVATVRSVTPGDRSCYAELVDERDRTATAMAVFDLCEQDAILNTRVRLTYEPVRVMAESCQGDPECRDSETRMLISRVEPVQERPAPVDGSAARLAVEQIARLRALYETQPRKTGLLVPTYVPERFQRVTVQDSGADLAYLVYASGDERVWVGTGELEGLGGPGLVDTKPCLNPVFDRVDVGLLDTDAPNPSASPEYQTEFWFEIPGRGNPADPEADGYAQGFTLAGNIDQDELILICESLRLVDVGESR